ncbi:hypothetical protein CGZ80_21190 [Rhodopirellula sp. MGV]|nr:hypothetical protein CGZ80_21190 [Rhodopirellula sp. MGV]PNY36004.1 hypothetical protein C2E31_15280 [Rhodopirellula baltica]
MGPSELMRFIIHFGLSVIGSVLIAGIGLFLLEPQGWIVFLLLAGGSLLGLSVARLFYRYVDCRRTASPSSRTKCIGQSHLPFGDRLRRFSGFDTPDHSEDFISNMPFWSRYKSYESNPPKSSLLIRRILIRIRAIIRNSSGVSRSLKTDEQLDAREPPSCVH